MESQYSVAAGLTLESLSSQSPPVAVRPLTAEQLSVLVDSSP